ncbi:YbhB/YbcL family Raf kinase inhibitor-like protein [Desulfobaculum bizertense]|uniref:Phospholipid-binding protein, PBP family n=1 Tax=Desulfobaculum bizertense DSM 18034 TaxID=1121442 RepID=A0A1T4VHW7_9BACT|nr:YbhB/YbcL family Raf kinase inhibitor-like protein [Desulfobaculum bizertense]UIJ37867.1 YbhB/YbcL family Raf kinase inhibitor-like protein [Desulfobaculum bizertense]SKA64527.1 phospholipid-binding protein, PBP family [Desulfobaculum bizertense DSM 18034]
MKLTSSSFPENGRIPIQFTCDASDFSPSLDWEDAPENAEGFALICEDPDAPGESPWVHWVLYGIPSVAFRLAAKIPRTAEHPSGLRQGLNSWGRIGYNGPCPPENDDKHRYIFTLYALDNDISLAPEASKEQLLEAMEGHILDTAQVMCTYSR